ELPFGYLENNDTALTVTLPNPVQQGESVTVDIVFVMRLPPKQGRWGQWEGVTYLSNWLPVVAYYDDKGWEPTPFIPWHQPFFNEAGNYQVRVTLPADQKIGHSGTVVSSKDIASGLREVEISAPAVRDFALVCCARFQEWTGEAAAGGGRPVKVRCLAFPEHEFHAKVMLKAVCDCMPVYAKWCGPYPY